MYSSGKTGTEIGKYFGCSRKAITSRRLRRKGMIVNYKGITYLEHKLADELQVKFADLISHINKCNNSGLGVMAAIGKGSHSLVVWKDPNGTTDIYDKDAAKTILTDIKP